MPSVVSFRSLCPVGEPLDREDARGGLAPDQSNCRDRMVVVALVGLHCTESRFPTQFHEQRCEGRVACCLVARHVAAETQGIGE